MPVVPLAPQPPPAEDAGRSTTHLPACQAWDGVVWLALDQNLQRQEHMSHESHDSSALTSHESWFGIHSAHAPQRKHSAGACLHWQTRTRRPHRFAHAIERVPLPHAPQLNTLAC